MLPSTSPKRHRVRLPLRVAKEMLKENAVACQAFADHLGSCPDCTEDFCPAAGPLRDAYRKARMRSRLYFGEDIDPNEVPSIEL